MRVTHRERESETEPGIPSHHDDDDVDDDAGYSAGCVLAAAGGGGCYGDWRHVLLQQAGHEGRRTFHTVLLTTGTHTYTLAHLSIRPRYAHVYTGPSVYHHRYAHVYTGPFVYSPQVCACIHWPICLLAQVRTRIHWPICLLAPGKRMYTLAGVVEF